MHRVKHIRDREDNHRGGKRTVAEKWRPETRGKVSEHEKKLKQEIKQNFQTKENIT